MLIYFGIILVTAFLLQGLLGLRQIKNFSNVFHELRTLAPVTIGKNPKKLRSGTLILIAVDNNGRIREAQIMKGVTVFARFKELKMLKNKNLAYVAASNDQLKEFDRLTRVCLLDAYKNYINYRTNKLKSEDIDTSIKIWSLPMVEKIKSFYYRMLKRGDRKQIN
ncbi:transcriptional regulator GutM [Ligilactobacillus sp. WILCCON 0076]|uniref:Transcriptional regulator GutM n=1 Tax=Ligilactobacillus ubinensis TaxID=2876789 RepID=A0A9X2FKV2_9LACO|nr:transcriptional regulator GutM [Ligilactobacillus ubinensis]MCP0887471.1 transcriptional regulator GutM [Ligilactobacillus ubinensis]